MKRLIIALFLCLLSAHAVAEEGIIFEFPDHIRIAPDADIVVPNVTADQPVNQYTVTLRSFQDFFTPALFPDGMIASVGEYVDPERIGTGNEKNVDFQFADGSSLHLSSAFGMEWMGENASKYHQLIQYIYDHDISLEQRALDFMSADEAVKLCGDILERMNLHYLTMAAVYGLSSDNLALYTERMAADYSDMKLECFAQATDHDAVYCVLFRSVFDALPTVCDAPFPSYGGAQCLFIVREDGPVYMEISKVIESVDAVTEQPVAITLEDALKLFCKGKEVARSDADDYEITRIAYGYYELVGSDPAYANRQTTYVPYYQMDYLYTLHFGDQIKQIPCEILMNALDGAIIRVRGV